MPSSRNAELSDLLALCRLDRPFVHAEGVWLTDQRGRKFLDAYAQFGAMALGHNAPEVKDAVLRHLAADAPAMCQPYPAAEADALAEALFAAAPGDLRRCVFTTSGTEAVEAAIKLVRARSGRELVVGASNAFHGRSLAARSLTGRHSEGFGALATGFARVRFGDEDALAAIFAAQGDRIAALVLEPIQGEGGVHVAPPGYLARARALCTRHGAALVLDEIQTGLGRTGALFACQHEGVAPDVLLLAKALGGGLFPLGACLASEAWWSERFAFGHSSTFANNNVACAVGRVVLRALTDGGLCARAAAAGDRLLAGLHRLAARYPRVIAEVRGRGLLAAIELVPPDADRSAMLGYLHHQGLFAHAAAATLAETASVLALPTLGCDNVLRIAPPLVITDEQIDLVVDGLESFCAQLQRNPVETIARGLGWLTPAPAADAPVSLPAVPRRRAPAGRRRWGFLIHYTQADDVGVTDPGLRRLTAGERDALLARLGALPAGVCLTTQALRSPATGIETDGVIVAVPLLPEAMLRRGRRAMCEMIARAVDLAAHHGAEIVGLGGFTTPLTNRGAAVVGRGPRITTGNALTAGMSFRAVMHEAQRRLPLDEATVGVLGARGSVGALMARLFARERPRRMVLVGSPLGDARALDALAAELRATGVDVIATQDRAPLRDCDIVVTATGAGRVVLDESSVSAGALVCDVARPADTSPALRARLDVTVLEGGLVALPDAAASFGPGNLQGLPDGVQLACLSETILHALAGTTGDFGVGDDVPLAQVDELMALAARHELRAAFRVGGTVQVVRAAGAPSSAAASTGGPR